MRGLFGKIEISSSCDLGKKDKKAINKELRMEILGKDKEYKIHKCKNKAKLIAKEGSTVLFCFNRKYFPTIRYLEGGSAKFSEIYLDDGALGPLKRGADVMTPGIFKYKDLIKDNFKVGDIIVVRIIGKSIVAVGESLIDFKDVNSGQIGIGVEVYHRVDDELYKEKYI